jgi:hypothetical protein
MSDRLKIGAGIAAVAAAVVLFLVLQGGGSNDSKDKGSLTVNGKAVSGIPTIQLRDGEPVGGIEKLQVASGEPVRFRVSSNIEGEVHVHGYDYEKPINAGGSVAFDFPAKLQGGFEIELHHGGGENAIAELNVVPG